LVHLADALDDDLVGNLTEFFDHATIGAGGRRVVFHCLLRSDRAVAGVAVGSDRSRQRQWYGVNVSRDEQCGDSGGRTDVLVRALSHGDDNLIAVAESKPKSESNADGITVADGVTDSDSDADRNSDAGTGDAELAFHATRFGDRPYTVATFDSVESLGAERDLHR
jgi:hypothetical protein